MTKNLHSLIHSVEEEMVESKKGRRQPQQTLRCYQPCQPFQFSTIAHCISCSLIPFITHTLLNHTHTLTLRISQSLNFSYLRKLIITLALTWIVTLLIVQVLLTFIPFITHVLANRNPQQYACQMYLPYSLHRPSHFWLFIVYTLFSLFSPTSPICCTHPSHVRIPPISFICTNTPHHLYPSGPCPHQQH